MFKNSLRVAVVFSFLINIICLLRNIIFWYILFHFCSLILCGFFAGLIQMITQMAQVDCKMNWTLGCWSQPIHLVQLRISGSSYIKTWFYKISRCHSHSTVANFYSFKCSTSSRASSQDNYSVEFRIFKLGPRLSIAPEHVSVGG